MASDASEVVLAMAMLLVQQPSQRRVQQPPQLMASDASEVVLAHMMAIRRFLDHQKRQKRQKCSSYSGTTQAWQRLCERNIRLGRL
jgi:hypothetical protein